MYTAHVTLRDFLFLKRVWRCRPPFVASNQGNPNRAVQCRVFQRHVLLWCLYWKGVMNEGLLYEWVSVAGVTWLHMMCERFRLTRS